MHSSLPTGRRGFLTCRGGPSQTRIQLRFLWAECVIEVRIRRHAPKTGGVTAPPEADPALPENAAMPGINDAPSGGGSWLWIGACLLLAIVVIVVAVQWWQESVATAAEEEERIREEELRLAKAARANEEDDAASPSPTASPAGAAGDVI